MRAFITGGTGFIGTRLVQCLLKRGDEVLVLTRHEEDMARLNALGTTPILGDVLDRCSFHQSMQGCDVVFHLAGWYKLGTRDQSMAEEVNVTGTRNVLETALELSIPKIIYTSSIAVFGDTSGILVDETYRMPPGRKFLTEYDRTKWKAHYEVALPLITQGAPLIVILPGVVYGAGDPSLVGQLMRAFYRGWLVLFPGPETTLSFAHVDDIAAGLILAAVNGIVGETYILGGPTISLRQAAQLWAKVTGKKAPLFYVPAAWIHHLEPLSRFVNKFLPLAPLVSVDGIRILGVSYAAGDEKARIELHWDTRSLEQGFSETFRSMDSASRSISSVTV